MDNLLSLEVKSLDEENELLDTPELDQRIADLGHDWQMVDHHHLTKKYEFPNFETALDFVNKVGAFAEETNHHPEIRFSWGWVELEIYTHKYDGLRLSDFVWCAKVEQISNED